MYIIYVFTGQPKKHIKSSNHHPTNPKKKIQAKISKPQNHPPTPSPDAIIGTSAVMPAERSPPFSLVGPHKLTYVSGKSQSFLVPLKIRWMFKQSDQITGRYVSLSEGIKTH